MDSAKVSPRHLHGLDTLRAAAIVLVMLYHFRIQGLLPEVLAPVAQVGWIGVDLFFVLSGFLIGCQIFKPYVEGSKPSLKEFYERRAYRILPTFVVVLLLYVLVPLWREAPGPYAAWQYATFTWNLLLLGYPEHRAFSHVWSLCVEEHFYLVFPVVVIFLMRKPGTWKTAGVLLMILIAGIGLRGGILEFILRPAGDEQGHMMMRYIYYPTYARLDGLLVGVTLAVIRSFKVDWWARMTRYGNLLVLAGVVCLLGALWLCGFEYPSADLPLSILFAFPLLACGFGLLVLGAAFYQGFLPRRIPGARTLAALAFSLYLTHKSVAHAVHLLLPGVTADTSGWRSFAIYCAACLGVASLLHFAVERPFIALRVRRRGGTGAEVRGELQVDPAL